MVSVILEDIIPDYSTIIKCTANISIAGDKHASPFIVVAVVILNNGVFTQIVAVKTTGINIAFVINRITGFIKLPQCIIAIIRIGSVSCSFTTASKKQVVL